MLRVSGGFLCVSVARVHCFICVVDINHSRDDRDVPIDKCRTSQVCLGIDGVECMKRRTSDWNQETT